MKVCAVGSRTGFHWGIVYAFLRQYPPDTHFISGGAKGVDSFVKEFTKCSYQAFTEVLPDWDTYGKSAGAIRNKQMVDMCDEVIAFWDGKSKGTKITIDYANKVGKPCKVVTNE